LTIGFDVNESSKTSNEAEKASIFLAKLYDSVEKKQPVLGLIFRLRFNKILRKKYFNSKGCFNFEII
tara:strand:+ start:337 stop:537 length:201 start_codon:yes stop_codon:yes gene_type:complete